MHIARAIWAVLQIMDNVLWSDRASQGYKQDSAEVRDVWIGPENWNSPQVGGGVLISGICWISSDRGEVVRGGW